MDAKYKKAPYIRVNKDFFKVRMTHDRYGIPRQQLLSWNRATLVDDYGLKGFKKMLKNMPHYDSFDLVPGYKNHSYDLPNKNYNLFKELPWAPKKGSWRNIQSFLEHIFEEQYVLGIKYFQVLYQQPDKALPILCLVSEEQMTGKTTFLQFISILFSGNTCISHPSEFMQHKSHIYADKNIICIEEMGSGNWRFYDKLKFLSTTSEVLYKEEYVKATTVPFYGKLILTSNKPDSFLSIDQEETRLWVRKINSVKKSDPDLITKMIAEIPHFLDYLDRQPAVKSKSRMVFDIESLSTQYLEQLKRESKSNVYEEILNWAQNYFETNREQESLFFTVKDVQQAIFSHNNSVTFKEVRTCIEKEFNMVLQPRARWVDIYGAGRRSQYYQIDRD